MKRLEYIPRYEELDEFYGNPESDPGVVDPLFIDEYLIRIIMPYYMRLSWKPDIKVSILLVHRRIASVVIDALDEIKAYRGEDYLHANNYDYLGGSYNFRLMRAGTELSTHSWGAAIDLNPHLAPYRQKENLKWMNHQPDFIRDAFINRGFVSFPWDAMHFQAVLSFSANRICNENVIHEINEIYKKRKWI